MKIKKLLFGIVVLFLLLAHVQGVSALEIGNNNYPHWNLTVKALQQNTTLTWDVWGRVPDAPRPNVTIIAEKYETHSTFTLTNLTWIANRFALSATYKDTYDYAYWLFMEEIYHPSENARNSWMGQPLSKWDINGTATFAGIEVKLLRTWVIEEKGQAWNQTWWDAQKLENDYDDPLVWEWSIWYARRLYEAWHIHIHSLGKKTGIRGLVWTGQATSPAEAEGYIKSRFFPSPIWQYVFSNYDLIYTHQYPQSLSQTIWSQNEIRALRENLSYTGMVVHSMTSSFAFDPWLWTEEIAWDEFQKVAPYSDVIIAFGYSQHSLSYGLDAWPPYLIKFYNQYNGSVWNGTTAPQITSWGNTKTNDNITTITVNTSEFVTFNVTSDQAGVTWNWYKDGILAGNTTNSYSTSWDYIGTKNITVSGANSNGTTNSVTWSITVLPLSSPKFGVGGNAWDLVGTISNVYIEDNKLKLGFWGDNFDDGQLDWASTWGNVSIVDGKLKFISTVSSGWVLKSVGTYSNSALFFTLYESNTTGHKAAYILSNSSLSSPNIAYQLSLRTDGNGLWITKYNGTSWIDLNDTATFGRTDGNIKYCIFKAYVGNLRGYCSNTSYTDALSSGIKTQATDTNYSYGDQMKLSANFPDTTGVNNVTYDDLRLILVDVSGNLINYGSKTIYYNTGTGNATNSLIINATTPTNTNYTVSYRQKFTGPFISLGTYTGNQTIPITGTTYQDTEVNITLAGNGSVFPEILTLEFSPTIVGSGGEGVSGIWKIGEGGNVSWFNDTTKSVNNITFTPNNAIIGISSDHFNRIDNTNMNDSTGMSKWWEYLSGFKIVNQEAFAETTWVDIQDKNVSLTDKDYNISFKLRVTDKTKTGQMSIGFYQQNWNCRAGTACSQYSLRFYPLTNAIDLIHSTATIQTSIGVATITINDGDNYLIDTSTVATGLKLYKNNVLVYTYPANTSYTQGAVGIGVSSNGTYRGFDDYRVWYSKTNTGSINVSYNAETGNETWKIVTSSIVFANTNITYQYAQNGTQNWTTLGTVTASGTDTFTLANGSKYQNTDVRAILNGNATASSEIENIAFYWQTQTSNPNNYMPATPQNITVSYPDPFEVYVTWEEGTSTGNKTDIYYVGYDIGQTGTFTWNNASSNNWIQFTDLTPHIYVDYKIHAHNNSGDGTLNETPATTTGQVSNNAVTISGIDNDYYMVEGAMLNISMSASDMDNDNVTISNPGAGWAVTKTSNITANLNLTTTDGWQGEYVYTVWADDLWGSNVSKSFNVHVSDSTPNITTINSFDYTLISGDLYYVTMNCTGVNADLYYFHMNGTEAGSYGTCEWDYDLYPTHPGINNTYGVKGRNYALGINSSWLNESYTITINDDSPVTKAIIIWWD